MEKAVLNAHRREQMGKEATKKVRREKKIPAVFYGEGAPSIPIVLNALELDHVLHTRSGANTIITLKISGENRKDRTAIIKEIQQHPVTDEIQHVDLHAISLTERIRVRVPLHDTGESPGVTKGGILDRVHHEIEIECLPANIPEKIDVDISSLDFGHAIHVKDLKLPVGVISTLSPGEVVFTVSALREEVEEAPKTEAVEPEVIKKGKEDKTEEDKEKAEPEKGKAEKAKPEKGKPGAEKGEGGAAKS